MKKTVRTLSLLLAVSFISYACQNTKENPEDAAFTVLVNAAAPGTKTVFGEKDGSSYPTLWTSNQKAAFSLDGAYDMAEVTPLPSADGRGATMSPLFTTAPLSSGVIYGFSPKGFYKKATGENRPGFSAIIGKDSYLWIVCPANQTPMEHSCDEQTQLLFGEYAYSGAVPSEIDMDFRHVSAYGKMALTNFEGGEVESLSITFPVAVAGNSVKYFYDSGSFSGADGKTLILSGENVVDNVFWFSLIPTGDLVSGDIVVRAHASDGEVYTKTISLSASKSISFTSGRVSSFSVDMSESSTGGGEPVISSGRGVYTITSKTSVSTSGTVPEGSSAQYSQTYGTVNQMTLGNSSTLTLSGYDGAVVTGITLSMRSNKSAGAGSLDVKVGSSTIASLSARPFTQWYDNTSWNNTSYSDVHVTLSDASRTVGEGEKIVIKITASQNSLYIAGYTIDYTVDGSGSGGGAGQGECSVTTISATSSTTSTAELSGSYSDAAVAPREAGFEYGLTASLGSEVMYTGALSGTEGNFTVHLDGLTEGARYYYRAYIVVQEGSDFVYRYGITKSFYVMSDDPVIPTPSAGGWYELPQMNVQKSGDYLQNASNTSEYFAYHMCTGGEKGPGERTARNYTVCYSGQHHCPVWVAAPRHSMYVGGSGRNDSYRRDGMIPSNIQYSSKSTGGGCNKGHMLGSAERTSSVSTNKDVFYYTNIAPQLATGFNTGGGGWNNLEDWVDKKVCADTLYEVVGCYFEPFTDGYGYTVNPQTIDFGGRSDVTRPSMFYYALIRTKNGNTGKALKDCSSDEIMCAAFVRSHTNSLKGQKPTAEEMMSISDLEQITGLTYFVNVPNAPKDSFRASDWGL